MAVNPQTMSGQPQKSKLTYVEYGQAEQNLPYWARSTNPIVRRHLGLYWRTIPPEIRPFAIILAVWTVMLLVGAVFPPIFAFTMISFLASMMVIPFGLVLYGHVLVTVAIEASRAMQMEMDNDTFELLRTTPMSLMQIFLGKVAAAIWKRMDDIIMVAQIAIAFSPPVIFSIYSDYWVLDGGISNFVAPTLTILGTLVILARCIVEPVMIGVMSVFIGLVVSGRSRAVTTAVVLGAFYFLLLNLLSRLPSIRGFETASGDIIPPNTTLIITVDMVLPVLLPILISFVLLKLGERIVISD